MFLIKSRSQGLLWRVEDEKPWFSTPPLRCPCKEISIKFSVIDIGRGEREGKLVIKLVRKGIAVAAQVLSMGTHKFSEVNLRISNVPILICSRAGDKYRLRRYGGNHNQRVSNFQLGLLGPVFVAPIESQVYDVALPVAEKFIPGDTICALTPEFKLVSILLNNPFTFELIMHQDTGMLCVFVLFF